MFTNPHNNSSWQSGMYGDRYSEQQTGKTLSLETVQEVCRQAGQHGYGAKIEERIVGGKDYFGWPEKRQWRVTFRGPVGEINGDWQDCKGAALWHAVAEIYRYFRLV